MENLFDIVLVVLAIGAVLYGASRGAIESAASAVGTVGGIWLGILLAPGILAAANALWANTIPQIIAVLVVVAVVAAVCGAIAHVAARALRRVFTRLPGGRAMDAVAGGVFGAAAWVLAVWLLAGLATSSGVLALAQLAQSSNVVSTINRVVPLSPSAVFGAVDDAFAAAGLPEVFSGAEAPIVAVNAPAASTPPAVAQQSASVFRINAQKASCGVMATGSGWPIGSDEIVTNAHVVSGASSVEVTKPGESRGYAATVVHFDPELDIAVLRAIGVGATGLTINWDVAAAGDDAYAVGYPGGAALTITPGRVRSVVQAVGLNIYNTSPVTRQVYSLRAAIRAGDSGGPLLNDNGEVIGVVFARSTADPETGYALTNPQLKAAFTAAATETAAVSTGACSAP